LAISNLVSAKFPEIHERALFCGVPTRRITSLDKGSLDSMMMRPISPAIVVVGIKEFDGDVDGELDGDVDGILVGTKDGDVDGNTDVDGTVDSEFDDDGAVVGNKEGNSDTDGADDGMVVGTKNVVGEIDVDGIVVGTDDGLLVTNTLSGVLLLLNKTPDTIAAIEMVIPMK